MLGCNNYEVIDLGVMVPADRILQTAVDDGADMIGLSGLITPSLDEMVFVAREMERRKMTIPLLIGGATTSRPHTAVKIAPEYTAQPVVHVVDASRAVDVVSRLLERDRARRLRREQSRRSGAAARSSTRRSSGGRSCRGRRRQRNRFELDWTPPASRCPRSPARASSTSSLETIVPYIDWTFFFAAWELKGRFPAILDHPQYGRRGARAVRPRPHAARSHRGRASADDPRRLRLLAGPLDGDDIVVYRAGTGSNAGHSRSASTELLRFNMLRQQEQQPTARRISRSPTSSPRIDSGLQDYLGAFAITGGIGAEELARTFERDQDDYHAIMVKALADRLAEASAEWLHARARGTGATAPASSCRRRDLHRRDAIAAFVRRSAIRPAPITARNASCSICCRPGAPASH